MRLMSAFVVTLCLGSPLLAQTQVIFTGRVDEAPAELQPQFQVGMSMSGSYTVDESLTPDAFVLTITEFQMTIGDYFVQMPEGDLRGDVTVSDTEYVAVSFASGEPVGDGLTPFLMALQMQANSGGLDPNSILPPSIDLFDQPIWTVDFNGGDSTVRLSGTVETLLVPEPSSSTLLLLGCLAVVRSRSIRQKLIAKPS